MRTPTANFSVFSGRRASGRRRARPVITTTTPAAAAPRIAGINIRPADPTAMTMKTTSIPSSTTALKVVAIAIVSHQITRTHQHNKTTKQKQNKTTKNQKHKNNKKKTNTKTTKWFVRAKGIRCSYVSLSLVVQSNDSSGSQYGLPQPTQ